MRAAIVKRCACGKRYSLAGWQRLPFQGVIQPEDNAFAELRLCACGSSIALPVRIVSCFALVPVEAA
jgi:hypothetical protein